MWRNRSKWQFNAANYDRIEITIKKGTKSTLKEAADAKGESLTVILGVWKKIKIFEKSIAFFIFF